VARAVKYNDGCGVRNLTAKKLTSGDETTGIRERNSKSPVKLFATYDTQILATRFSINGKFNRKCSLAEMAPRATNEKVKKKGETGERAKGDGKQRPCLFCVII
jgi:hypothetical protein